MRLCERRFRCGCAHHKRGGGGPTHVSRCSERAERSGSEGVAVFDIAGGSTEIVIGTVGHEPLVGFSDSFNVGSVRLGERHLAHDPPSAAEIEQVIRAAAEAFARVPCLPSGTEPVGVAGTMTTLASGHLGQPHCDRARVHGCVLSRAEVDRVVGRFRRSLSCSGAPLPDSVHNGPM